jgi:hypothetical protein
MAQRLHASHRIVVDAAVDQVFMFFTPPGEELWVDGWKPTYVYPRDGRTESGMVFTTGQGDELTIWTLTDFDREAHRSRYLRCTPASRTSLVEVRCVALGGAHRSTGELRTHRAERCGRTGARSFRRRALRCND